MKTTNLITLIVVLVVVLVVVLAFARPVQAPVYQNGQEQTQTQPAAQAQTVTTGGLSFSYTEPFALATTPEQILAKVVIPACDQGFDYCVYYNGTEYANTNFESAGVSVAEHKELPSQASCVTAQPSGYHGLKPKTSSQNGVVIGAYSPIGGGAAGSSESGAEYHVWTGSTCYFVRTRVAQAQFANYPAGTKVEFTTANRDAVFGELQNILDGMSVQGTQLVFPTI